jgi:Zn-dependent M16 (insulinase) family peptidase
LSALAFSSGRESAYNADMSQTPSLLLKPGQSLDGFQVRRSLPMPNVQSNLYELEHLATGAKILHLHNADAENLFCVTFPTPPSDDTGVPHILEHCVLGGSEKYAVKDPFFEMIKCSMATFINAMTASDYTVYPVASNVKQDFFNLADVYWDAVFHPTLLETTFQREGHHLEFLDGRESPLIIKGIVYNEMKGARSSPEAKVFDLVEKALWPDTPLGRDSGGDPERIPDLTFEAFKNFHRSFYHPTNGYIFFYGDIPTTDHLDFLRPRMAKFGRRPAAPVLQRQPRWTSPRRLNDVYAAGPEDKTEGKTFIVMNWLVGDATDVGDVLALAALERILLGNQGAPLRKALIESHLGEDLTHSGMWVNGNETSFHVGIKGSETARTADLENLVINTLKQVADRGVSAAEADAAFQQLAYHYLEISSMYPLHLMSQVVQEWIHGADPIRALLAADELEALKKQFASDPSLFSRLIRQRLLDNAHRLTITVAPDTQIRARKEREFTERMKKLKESLSTAELDRVAARQRELEALLNAPNPPEALAALPQLRVRDLPARPRHIPTTVERSGHVEFLKNDVFANGVNYLQLSFDLSHLPAELWPYLPLYSDCIGKMGAAGHDYAAMAQRVAAHTGGIGFAHTAAVRADDPTARLRRATFSTKFLNDKADAALAVMRDFIFDVDPNDAGRLRDVLMQVRAHHRFRPASEGMGIALQHAGRGFSPEGLLREIWGGVPQTHLVERLAAQEVEPLIEKLLAVRSHIVRSGGITASFTGTDRVHETVRKQLADWTSRAAQAAAPAVLPFEPLAAPPREGLAAPMDVAYCVTVFPAPHISHPDAPVLGVGNRMVSFEHVLEEVRFKGTAYGGGCAYSGASSTWEFHSYRDPWINRTLDVYNAATDFVRKAEWSQADVDRSIIGSAKEFERPIRPGDATGTALWRHLMGDTPERREARHAAMLRATPATIRRALLDVFESGFAKAAVCVVSSREKLEAANREQPEKPLEISDILQG